ncbi:MAG: MoaD/ThiS family protein [Deltaproteobacteria bacterium]|nr:MoaD/ThiS family protein [Deltaproteobacteria bacterium]
MKVYVTFVGPLAEYAGGVPRVEFDLPEGAVYGDLLEEIDRRFGPSLHERIWDRETKTFQPRILVLGEGRDHEGRETPLADGEQIKVIPILAGG